MWASTSFRTFYSEGPYGDYVRGVRDISGGRASLLEIAQPAGSFPDVPNPDFVIAMALGGPFRTVADKGAGRYVARMRPGLVGITPPNVATQFTIDDPSRFLILTVNNAHACEVLAPAAPGFREFGRLHSTVFDDEAVAAALKWLWRETHGPDASSLFADSAIVFLLHALLRRSQFTGPSPPSVGGLAPWQERRATAYLNDHLADDVSLGEVAAQTGLSLYHFARAFKASTGLPPYRYLMKRRVERAKELLAATTMSVTEIAFACGFASSQHLAAVFRRQVGATPTAYRRGWRR